MDLNKVMASLGMESFVGESILTEEQEMLNEIALEAELDVNFMEMDGAAIVSVLSDADVVNCGLAEREIALECNEGRDAATIYAEFGLEAIKDVAARHAYTGVANIKALINKVISWLKNLLGMGTTVKKIAKSLKAKAKNELKALNKYAGRDMSKLKRTMPTGTDLQTISGLSSGDIFVSGDYATIKSKVKTDEATIKTKIEDLRKSKETLKEAFKDWKSSDEEYEGSACFNHVSDLIKGISTWAGNYESDKGQENIKKAIANLEKLRKDWNDAAAKDANDANGDKSMAAVLNQTVIQLNEQMSVIKAEVKVATQQADEILTHSKGVQAAL